ncbi:MAG: class I SAM-dependent methyltransferase [Gammaproteobacteria bacterium]|nr:class I SAM-dependent methyltransferase [Gammaproteobacteria bacterium]
MSFIQQKGKAGTMGDVNQITYLTRYLKTNVSTTDSTESLQSKINISGPILEVGSKDYGSTANFRSLFPENDYIGLDMAEGPGVDVIQDLTAGLGPLQENYFGLIICCSVLEHVDKPWVMAENLTKLLKPGGVLYMSVPWVWRYHAYPDDYFRFSWRGIMALFAELDWVHPCYSTNVPNEIVEIEGANTSFDNQMAALLETPNGSRKYLPYLMVNMLGHKGDN